MKLTNEVETEFGKSISVNTVRNALYEAGFHGRVARKKPFINAVNKQKRILFAKSHKNDGPEFWNKVIFSDESKYNIFGSDGRKMIWRQKNKELEEKNLKATVKHGGGSVLVWGCMSARGVGKLHFIEGIMDHKDYINILRENLNSSAEKMGLNNDYIFTQDNDPKHTAWNTKMWLLHNVPKWVETPPQSPDINPIENLWSLLENNIRKCSISSRADLKVALLTEWEKNSSRCHTKTCRFSAKTFK